MPRKRPLIDVKVNGHVKLQVTCPLPSQRVPYWELRKVTFHRPFSGIILNTVVPWYASHFDDKSRRNIPCLAQIEKECQYCGTLRKIVNGYVVCREEGKQYPQVVFLPAGVGEKIPLLHKALTPVAGRRLELRRQGMRVNLPLYPLLSDEAEEIVPSGRQIHPQEVYDWLWNYWGFKLRKEESE